MSTTPAMRHFVHAKEFAVLGKVLTDPERWDHKMELMSGYQARDLPVTPIKPTGAGETIEGIKSIADPVRPSSSTVHPVLIGQKALPNLSQTSLSVIIHPAKGLPLLQSLYPAGEAVESGKGPWAVWFQPGADDEAIRAYVVDNGLEGRVVVGGKCILVAGDGARAEEGLTGAGKAKSAL